jgi:hypothetical protein
MMDMGTGIDIDIGDRFKFKCRRGGFEKIRKL